ncbi:S9 family peptidase [Candidatus Leptofilum sp.]|uniref:S9 family peptidase n=1 Tax=Candidatus Leptofilum sp. TaxID=3241576 RepID=UPI003B5BE683
MSQAEKRPITADDLYKLELVSDPQISPDGSRIIFGLTRVDRKTEKKYSNLWLVPSDGSRPARQFTYGDQTDTHPRWSPDGRSLAFLSNRKDEKQFQIYVIPINGGEARPVTKMEGSFAGFVWSPDGRSFATQFRKKDAAAIEREKDEHKKKLGIVSRHITGLDYKFDGGGYTPQEKWHIWTIDAASGEATQLTDGDKFSETQPQWTPDGRSLIFISNRDPQPDLNWDQTELYRIPATGGKMELISSQEGRKNSHTISPDGNWIAFMGRRQKGRWYQNDCLYIVPINGGTARNLSGETDLHLSTVTLTDVGSGTSQTLPTWSADGRTITIQATEKGNQPVLAFSTDSDNPGYQRIINNAGLVGSFSLDASQQTIAYLWGDLSAPARICTLNLADGATQTLTQFNNQLLAELEVGNIEEVWFKAKDGTDLHGWIMTPPNFDPSQKYPSILEIHGGPQTQYGRAYFHELHLLAAQGYVVYWSNPRGSQGYGEDFAGAIYNRWGTVDFEDVMAWADYVEKLPYIDSERMGVTGGSYGGYMTTTIIGRTNRFKAAVAQRVVSNFISFYGSSDMNIGTEYLFGAEKAPWEDLENYWRQSPISTIGNATTPTLVIHSEADYRCDHEQGEQLFVALKKLGVDTELVLFPEESHGLSRAGRTDRRIERLNHMIRWFAAYL